MIKFTELNKTFIIKKKIKSHRNSRGRVKRQPARKRNEISASLDLSLSLFLAHLRCEPAAHEIPKPPPTFQNSQTPPFLVALPPPFSSAPDSLLPPPPTALLSAAAAAEAVRHRSHRRRRPAGAPLHDYDDASPARGKQPPLRAREREIERESSPLSCLPARSPSLGLHRSPVARAVGVRSGGAAFLLGFMPPRWI